MESRKHDGSYTLSSPVVFLVAVGMASCIFFHVESTCETHSESETEDAIIVMLKALQDYEDNLRMGYKMCPRGKWRGLPVPYCTNTESIDTILRG